MRLATTLSILLGATAAGCAGEDAATGSNCVTDLNSGQELCGADAERFCSELEKQRAAARRVERHDFLEERRTNRKIARDLETSADIQEQLGNQAEARLTRRSARDAHRDATKPFRPSPTSPTDLESARVCREALD